MKICAVGVIAILTVLIFPAAAIAKGNPRDTAKAAAEASISSYLPGGGGQAGVCDVRTQSGFFAGNKSYLAACGTHDSSFEYLAIFNATSGSLNVDSAYLKAELTKFCNGGAVFAAGVKGKFTAVFAGAAKEVVVARGLRDLLASQIKKTPGHSSISLC